MSAVATVLTGAAFGASLVASGVFQPSVIVSQLRLEDWHMAQAFLTATASSAYVQETMGAPTCESLDEIANPPLPSLLVTLFQSSGYANLKPRSFSPLGWFARYDGNVIGGLLLGHGMALSGACPGTVLSQVALGIRSGYYALVGATLGGIVWAGFLRARLSRPAPAEKPTVHESLGVSRGSAFLAFEAVLSAAVASATVLTTSSSKTRISPIQGGLLIGSAQLLSLALRKSLIGVSGSYEEVGDWVWSTLRSGSSKLSSSSILFSLGIIGGSFSIVRLFPVLGPAAVVDVTPLAAGVGGFLMVVGSRMAGGCTSGHGISGMSLLSVPSIITMAVALTWGVVVGTLQ